MRFPKVSRRWLWTGGITFGVLVLIGLALGVIYPRVGAYMIRERLENRLAKRIDRKITVGEIDVSLGHAVLRDVNVRGKLDGDTPLVHIARIDVEFDTTASLFGSVDLGDAVITDMMITLRRNELGHDNVRDVIDRLRKPRDGKGGSATSLRPKKITVNGIRMLADDAMSGTTALVANGDATWTKDATIAHLQGVSATTPNAPKADIKAIEIRKASGSPPIVTIEEGEFALWEKMSLSGITGSIVADPDNPGHYLLDFAGGYGGVPGRLWTAKGGFSPDEETASVDLVAAKFQLDRLAPILAKSAVVDYQTTSVDAQLHVALDREVAAFSGNMNLSGLNVGHPMIADKEVHGVDMSTKIAGSFNRATRTLELTQGDFVMFDVPFSVTGSVYRPRRDIVIPEAVQQPKKDPKDLRLDDEADDPVVTRGPYGIQLAKLRLVIPPISCQRFLDAIPAAMAPSMKGYKVKGMFDADVKLEIDWTNLDATVLGGHVGYRHCKVLDEPADSPKRLIEPFEHFVEVEEGEWISFVVGPENPDFVPITEISPYLIKSIMTTEDGAFYQHRGFITSEFRSALIRDLKAGKFKYGASSITMQMVKNALLYRQKTLARKLQELFLTWHVENTLEKDRILEIYFNVIEYGPALYGIGPAAREYFGKSAKDLNPVESAFFSTILPNPKDRYRQFCQGEVFKWTKAKMDRILALQLKRDRLTQEEYDKAVATPLVFAKNTHTVEHKNAKGEIVVEPETVKECQDRAKEAIENARPTAPPLPGDPVPKKKQKKKKKR